MTMIQEEPYMNKEEIDNEEIDITKILKIISFYKWLIITITLFFMIVATVFLYFKSPIYNAYTIIKVKDNRGFSGKNIVLKPAQIQQPDIKEDITLLKTFYMNNKALELNKVKLDVQYYVNKKYKNHEIFKFIPIRVEDIKVIDKNILGRKLIINSAKGGYKISFKYSFSEKLKSNIFGKTLLQLDPNRIWEYNKIISTKYFKFKVKKLSNFNKPIIIKINGNHRSIYESIIKQNLKVEQLEQGVPIIRISYQDHIQKRATLYINSLTDSFIKESIKNKSEQSNKILEFINRELNMMKERLTKSEKSLEKYQIENDATRPSLQAATFIKNLSDIEIELSENQLKEKLAENLMRFIKQGYSLDAIAPSLMELGEEPTLKLIEILQETQRKKDILLTDFTERHPKVIAERKKIDSLKVKIVKNITNLQKHISQKNKTLDKLKTSYENKIKSLPTKERKLVNIKRDYEVSSKMYNFLLEKQAENEIIKVATLSDYKVIDKAYSNSSPISPNFKMTIIASMLLGVFIGLIVAFIRNSLDKKIRDREDIESSTNLPIYATLIGGSSAKVEVYKKPNSPFTESYRALRSKLQLLFDRNSGCKTILITSTVSGEGKNITSANLSAILEIANYKSITIDFDLREPTLDKLFGIRNIKKGLANYLKGESNLYEIIYPTLYNNLNIIPVGEIPTNPSELILSNYIPKLIDELRKKYDYIIINSTPFGRITDTKHIMNYSDINLVLFRQNFSKKTYITNLHNMIREDGIKNIGIVYLQNSENQKELF